MTREEMIEKMARAIETHDFEYFSEWERLKRYQEMSIAALDVVTEWLAEAAKAYQRDFEKAGGLGEYTVAIGVRRLIATLKGETK